MLDGGSACDSGLLGSLSWVTDGRVLPLVVMSAAATSTLAARFARSSASQDLELDTSVNRVQAGTVHDITRVTPWQAKTSGDICKQCTGTGRCRCVDCYAARMQPATLLPKGQFPSWCMVCKARETVLCSRCLGTGKRPSIGFR